MESKKTKQPVDEHLNKIKHRIGYMINESPRYKPLADDVYDEVPMDVYATQDGMPVPNPAGSNAYLEEQDEEVGDEKPEEIDADELPAEEPMGEPQNVEEPPAEEPEAPAVDVDVQAEEPVVNDVDDIQNEIIKHNIEAMKDIHQKVGSLDAFLNNINQKLDALNSKVKEVEEPTSGEKLMSKKDVSYPYYFNLNDFWKGNFFEENRKKAGEEGMKQLPDGTYIADFDDLPLQSNDIKNSFNDII